MSLSVRDLRVGVVVAVGGELDLSFLLILGFKIFCCKPENLLSAGIGTV
tara:strand:- start:304 stop:450 length:147 start_codon:yes stop_codon:yes gene_type:complete